MSKIETVLPEPWIRGMDVTEVLAQGNFGNLYVRRGSWPFTISRSAPLMASSFTAIGGAGIAGTPFAPQRVAGQWVWRGISGTLWTNGRYLEDYQFPIGEDLSAATTRNPQLMEYCWEGVVNVPAPLVAGAPFHFGVFSQNATFHLSNQPGLVVFADVGVAPNWRVLFRRVALGATTITDTGIPIATPLYVRVRYRNTSNPQIWIEVNGVVFSLMTGLANVPTLADLTVANWKLGFGQGDIAASVPGQVFLVQQCRIWAQELPGYQ